MLKLLIILPMKTIPSAILPIIRSLHWLYEMKLLQIIGKCFDSFSIFGYAKPKLSDRYRLSDKDCSVTTKTPLTIEPIDESKPRHGAIYDLFKGENMFACAIFVTSKNDPTRIIQSVKLILPNIPRIGEVIIADTDDSQICATVKKVKNIYNFGEECKKGELFEDYTEIPEGSYHYQLICEDSWDEGLIRSF